MKKPFYILIFVIIIVLLLIFGYFYFWKKDAGSARLVPKDSMIYLSVSINGENLSKIFESQGNEQNSISSIQKLQESFWKSFGKDLNINFKEDLIPLIGDEIAFVKGSSEVSDPFTVFVKFKSKNEAFKKYKELKKRFGFGSEDFLKESYKSVKIYSVDEPEKLSAVFLDGYFVFSSKKDNLKEVIDVKKDNIPSLSSHQDFAKIKGNLAKSKNVAFAVIGLRDVLKASASGIDPAKQEWADKLSISQDFKLGIAVRAEDKNYELDFFFNTEKPEEKFGFDANLFKFVPQDAIGYFEGANFASFIQSVAGKDIKLSEDKMKWASKVYAITMMPGKNTTRSSFYLVMEVDNEMDAKEKMKGIEPAIRDMLASKGIMSEKNEFGESRFKGEEVRFMSFKKGLEMDINYAIFDKKLFAATSKDAMEKLIDSAKGDFNTLSDSPNFDKGYKNVVHDDVSSLIYLNSEALAEYLVKLTPGKVGFLEGILVSFKAMVAGSTLHKDGGYLISTYFVRE